MTSDDSARELIERARAGDRAAIEALLVQNLPSLRAYVRLRMGHGLRAREAESDILQSACRDVIGSMRDFRYGTEAGFRAWLYNATLRKIADRHEYWQAERRNPAREQRYAEEEEEGGGDAAVLDLYRTLCSPSEGAIAREVMERVEAAFQSLSDEHREVILLARVVGLSHAEIAQQMGRNAQSTRALLYRALSELSERMEDSEPERP